MKNLNFKIFLYLSILFLGWGCSVDDTFDNIEDAPREEKSNIKTVSIDEAIDVFNTKKLQRNYQKEEQFVTEDLDGIHHEALTNTHEKLIVIPAKIRYDGFYSRILMLRVNDTIRSVVFNMRALKDVEDTQSENYFTGDIIITDLNGKFLNGYKMEKGFIVGKYVKNKSLIKSTSIVRKYIKDDIYMYCDAEKKIDDRPHYINVYLVVFPGRGNSYNENFGRNFVKPNEVENKWQYLESGGENSNNNNKTNKLPLLDENSIINSTKLNILDKQKLDKALKEFIDSTCGNKALYDGLVNKGVKLNFEIKEFNTGYAGYFPPTKSILFTTSNNIKADFLAEELFHAYQDAYYPGGIEQYTKGDMKGRSNIEFEVKFFIDVICVRTTGACPDFGYITLDYQNLLNYFSEYHKSNGVFPSSFTIAQKKVYFSTLEIFKTVFPKYNYPSNDLLPNAAFEVLKKTQDCIYKMPEINP